ncbi:MAG: N-acetylmuramoyl-L-alanine amidase [Planctomycetota bacterium]|jgi:N-acetylmuramoyl-L-alanine amidase
MGTGARTAVLAWAILAPALAPAARAGSAPRNIPFLTEDAPLAPLARAFGFRVKGDVRTGRVRLVTDGHEIVLAPGLSRALVDGRGFPLLDPPRYVGGVLVVPPDLADLVRRLGSGAPEAGRPFRNRPNPGERAKVTFAPDSAGPARALFAGGASSATKAPVDRKPRKPGSAGFIVLDPGHGGSDGGARGAKGTKEKTVVLDIAKRTAAHLRRAGVRVVLTRYADTYVSPKKRAASANTLKPDAVLSLHTNSYGSRSACGVETWVLAPKVAAARKRTKENGRKARLLAGAVQKALVGALKDRDRGVREGNYTVLRDSKAPTALAEIGFISNAATEAKLASAKWRERIARDLARAILKSGVLVKRTK